jgi:ribosomal protein S20
MPATTTTTNRKSSKIRCPRCGREYTAKQAEKAFHRNKRSRSGFQTYDKACAKAIDAEKAAAKKSAA